MRHRLQRQLLGLDWTNSASTAASCGVTAVPASRTELLWKHRGLGQHVLSRSPARIKDLVLVSKAMNATFTDSTPLSCPTSSQASRPHGGGDRSATHRAPESSIAQLSKSAMFDHDKLSKI